MRRVDWVKLNPKLVSTYKVNNIVWNFGSLNLLQIKIELGIIIVYTVHDDCPWQIVPGRVWPVCNRE